MAKNEDVKGSALLKIKPIGDNQKQVFDTYDDGKNQFVYGGWNRSKHSFSCRSTARCP